MHVKIKKTLADFDLDVELNVLEQGVTVLFGPSGSGKTSVLNFIAGFLVDAAGEVSVAGEVWVSQSFTLAAHKRSFAYVFQEPSLLPHLNVKQNLDYAKRRSGPSVAEVSFDEVVDTLNLKTLLPRKPLQLSGGEKQRVALAQMLLLNAKVLLMDEPLASLDNSARREILSYLERLKTQLKIPIIYVTHNIEEVVRLADTVVIMRDGHVLEEGSAQDVLAKLGALSQGEVAHQLITSQDEVPHTILQVTVEEILENRTLIKAKFADQALFFRAPTSSETLDNQLTEKSEYRIRISARDVSLSTEYSESTSVLNQLKGVIRDIQPQKNRGEVFIVIDVAGHSILADITTYSLNRLALRVGQEVWVLVKGLSVL